ncbi:MAG: hypothetical protein GY835_18715 [bacterium]|nr:hypothetical protein [bacterium]
MSSPDLMTSQSDSGLETMPPDFKTLSHPEQQIRAMALEHRVPVWLAGHVGPDSLGMVKQRLPLADLVLCILGSERPESMQEPTGIPLRAANLEIEMLQARLHEKPIYLFIRKDFEPDPGLRLLIYLLGTVHAWSTDAELYSSVRELVRRYSRGRAWWMRRRSKSAAQLIQGLAKERSRILAYDPDLPAIYFLDHKFLEDTGGEPDIGKIDRLLREEATLKNEEERIARLWPAMLEILRAPYNKKKYLDYLPHWSTLLGRWTRTSSWFGLHGHFLLGPLASLNSLGEVRDELRNSGKHYPGEPLSPPSGALATEYYSIAKRLPFGSDRRKYFTKAREKVEEALDEDPGARDGLLAIRGSIYLRQWQINSAVKDYNEVVKLRKRKGDASLGEALAELGFAYVRQGRVLKGRQIIEDAVTKFPPGNSGFLIRAKKKLAVACALSGCPRRAWELRSEARRLAEESGALDQM